jgi:hypothetical protein
MKALRALDTTNRMTTFKSRLLAYKAALIALYRMSKEDYILVSNGMRFRVPKDKITLLTGPVPYDFTIQQARQLISLIGEACRTYESRSAKIGSANYTIVGRLRAGKPDNVRITIYIDFLSGSTQWLDRASLLKATTEISRRIGFYPDEDDRTTLSELSGRK